MRGDGFHTYPNQYGHSRREGSVIHPSNNEPTPSSSPTKYRSNRPIRNFIENLRYRTEMAYPCGIYHPQSASADFANASRRIYSLAQTTSDKGVRWNFLARFP